MSRAAGEELRALLHLRLLPRVGDVRLRTLLDRYGSARAALRAPAKQLGAEAVAERGSKRIRGRIRRALETVERLGATVLLESDEEYPDALRHLHDPPPVLFARGRLELLERPAVAIVGARRHTDYGAETAATLARDLARAGLVVVSGMARGIDAIAQRAALAGGTIGVLGCGIDVVYPKSNKKLYERVISDGLLLSEFVPGEPPQSHNFPKRNRLIAALAGGVVVVEASAKSGSLITTDHALDLGREIFAVPGPIDRGTSVGTNALIQDGAKLVTGVGDVLEELRMTAAQPPAPPSRDDANEGDTVSEPPGPPPELEGTRLALWQALGERPVYVDELAASCELSPEGALATLLTLELEGHVRQVAGKRFVRG